MKQRHDVIFWTFSREHLLTKHYDIRTSSTTRITKPALDYHPWYYTILYNVYRSEISGDNPHTHILYRIIQHMRNMCTVSLMRLEEKAPREIKTLCWGIKGKYWLHQGFFTYRLLDYINIEKSMHCTKKARRGIKSEILTLKRRRGLENMKRKVVHLGESNWNTDSRKIPLWS